MSWLKSILGVLASLLVVIVIVGLLLPSKVHVERKITINTQPQTIYPLIANFEEWDKWSPWAKIDPEAEFTIIGSGLGQKMLWSSEDPRVGKGSQEIMALDAPKQIKTHLDFGEQGMADASFALISENDETEVTWSLDTDMRKGVPLYMKPFSAYLGFFMDSMIGKDYERGLANLRDKVES
ncbi:MAG: SRPBCC family protein [Xenococcaceae cyanobacterium MO_188.B32]|nr:SRPBCC family protein [Xenococcaceae cyanobacterium MO_188.B32]